MPRVKKEGSPIESDVPEPISDSDGPRIFSGFPLPFTEDKIAELRGLADMLERGEAQITSLLVCFQYYHVSSNAEGYEVRTGLVKNLAPRANG